VTWHRYPAGALVGDYARAAFGLGFVTPPLVLLSLDPAVAAMLAILVLLFLVFAGRTLLLQLGPLEMTESEIRSRGPRPVRIPWAELDDLKLAYFATGPRAPRGSLYPVRRDGSGWMQLALRAGGRRLRLDSRIEDFAAIVVRAAGAARQRRLPLNATTAANLAAFSLGGVFGEER
jgi:hypothetical protein